jgi:hypothetical protein
MPFAVVLLILCMCCGRQSAPEIQKSERNLVQPDTVKGSMSVAGNEPFARLILTTSAGLSMEISADTSMFRSLWKLQNTNVVLIGVLRHRISGSILEVREFIPVPQKEKE